MLRATAKGRARSDVFELRRPHDHVAEKPEMSRPCFRLCRRCPQLWAHELQSGVGAELETQKLLKTHGQVNEPAGGSFVYVRLFMCVF